MRSDTADLFTLPDRGADIPVRDPKAVVRVEVRGLEAGSCVEGIADKDVRATEDLAGICVGGIADMDVRATEDLAGECVVGIADKDVRATTDADLLHAHLGWAGVDEAGRGPLAGPVYAAAVILPEGFDCAGIDDSKVLDAPTRDALAARIRAECAWCIATAEPDEIDRLNILHATMAAMRRAVEGLSTAPQGVLVDGNRVPTGLAAPAQAVIDGDAIHACIAAASILAKTARDAHMVEQAVAFPEYGFDKHFGYGTPEHLAALRVHGPCAIHRRSFAPIRASDQLCLTFEE